MLKIKKENINTDIEYQLENDVYLFNVDWNGECYLTGATETEATDVMAGYKDNNRRYDPVYKEVAEDEFEIIGFEEI